MFVDDSLKHLPRMKDPAISDPDPDFAAFDRIYQQYAARMVVFARRFVDGKYAEDLVQDVFLRIWQQKHFRLPAAELRALLYRSVLNACRNLIRHDQVADKYAQNALRRIRLGEVDYELRVLDEQQDELTERLYAQIDALPERCREVFFLSRFQGLKNREIAERLHISLHTVERHIQRALRIFAEALEREQSIYLQILILAWLMNQPS